MANDSLARGAKSAVFPSCSHVSQEHWDSIFGKPEELTETDRAMAKAATATHKKFFKAPKKVAKLKA